LSLLLWRRSIQGASTRFIFEADFFPRKCHLSFHPPPSAGSRLLVSFAVSAHPSLMRRCQLRSQGVHRGGPLGPSSSQVLPGASPRRSWILPSFFSFFLCHGVWAASLAFLGLLLPSPHPLGEQGPLRLGRRGFLFLPCFSLFRVGSMISFCRCLTLGFRLGRGGGSSSGCARPLALSLS
jgi:hypothetical protein